MAQPPPDMEVYEAEVRRRIEMANSPRAAQGAPPYGDGAGASGRIARYEPVGGAPRESGPAFVAVVMTVATVMVIAALAFSVFLGSDARSQLAPVASATSHIGEASTSDMTDGVAPDATEPPFASRQDPAEMYDSYMAMKRDGAIYEIIPDTDEGRDYFTAFMYSVVDLKAALLFGPVDEEALAELATREQHFLALEDLELTVDITFDDGTSFTHDGRPPLAG